MRDVHQFERELRAKLTHRTLLTPSEAAFMVEKDVDTINRYIRAGLPFVTDPRDGRRYVKLDDVHNWIDEHPTRRHTPRTQRG